MPAVDQTPTFKLNLPTFDLHAWHTYVNENFSIIDAVLNHYLDIQNLVGVWRNSTAYTVGQRTIDPTDGSMYECLVNNTSAAAPTTFTQDRVNNPSYWGGFISGISSDNPHFTGLVTISDPSAALSVAGSIFADNSIELINALGTDGLIYTGAALSGGQVWGFGTLADGRFTIQDYTASNLNRLTIDATGNLFVDASIISGVSLFAQNSIELNVPAGVDSLYYSLIGNQPVWGFGSLHGSGDFVIQNATTLTNWLLVGTSGAVSIPGTLTVSGQTNLANVAITGNATAPTQAAHNNSTKLATTAYVDSAVAASGVTTFNTRTGAVTLLLADVTAVGGAPLASPALTGTPTAPTAAVDTNTTQLSTTAFVLAQASAVLPNMDGAASIGAATRFARSDHRHPTDTNLLPLTGGSLAGPGNLSIAGTLGVTGAITPAQVAGIVGTNAANNAAAGSVGEYVQVDKLVNVALTTAVMTNVIATMSLTAGDWDVDGTVSVVFSVGGQGAYAQINTVSATFPADYAGNGGFVLNAANQLVNTINAPTGLRRVSVASTTTVYLITQALFTSGTANAQGSIRARRVR